MFRRQAHDYGKGIQIRSFQQPIFDQKQNACMALRSRTLMANAQLATNYQYA